MSPYRVDPPQLWPGLTDAVPDEFRQYVDEPAFSFRNVLAATVCLWRQRGDDRWMTGALEYPDASNDPDGSNKLFGLLADAAPEAYQRYAQDYFGADIDLTSIGHVFGGAQLTEDVVLRLNPDLTVADVANDLAEIGYPIAT